MHDRQRQPCMTNSSSIAQLRPDPSPPPTTTFLRPAAGDLYEGDPHVLQLGPSDLPARDDWVWLVEFYA
jgi:hypothetical protein